MGNLESECFGVFGHGSFGLILHPILEIGGCLKGRRHIRVGIGGQCRDDFSAPCKRLISAIETLRGLSEQASHSLGDEGALVERFRITAFWSRLARASRCEVRGNSDRWNAPFSTSVCGRMISRQGFRLTKWDV